MRGIATTEPDTERGVEPTPTHRVARADARATMAARSTLVETAYHRHRRDVLRYLLVLTRSEPDAEELTSEVFLRALRAWREPVEPPLPWLLTIARRLATDRWRRAARFARSLARLGEPAVGVTDPARTEFWDWYDAIARVLTDRQREVLALRYQRDLTDAQIAAVMGLSESGVRSLVARALVALRNHPEVL